MYAAAMHITTRYSVLRGEEFFNKEHATDICES